MPQTLDQQRAQLAWRYATAGIQQYGKEYKNLAKGAPALIMNSGLMPTLAFYQGKDPQHQQLLQDLMAGLVQRLQLQPTLLHFRAFMAMLQNAESRDYMRYTDEALELLKWIRQFVDAVDDGGN